MSSPRPPSLHAQLVRRVHTAKSWLKLDDGTYRMAIASHAPGKSSSLTCSVAELQALMEHFHRVGYPRPGQVEGKPARKPFSPRQKKMWALWQSLADAHLVRDRTLRGLLAWISSQTDNQVQALDFLTTAQEDTLIESMKKWKERGNG